MKKDALAFRQEFWDQGEMDINGSCEWKQYEDYRKWLEHLQLVSQGRQEGQLPSSAYFAFHEPNHQIVGIVDIRHYLTSEYDHNGHIEYSVRPSERGKGYATEILRLALDKARGLGILDVRVTCGKNNLAARKVIRRNGLVRKKEIQEAGGNAIWLYGE
ncbi:MAG: GNAT family N-acetyltransferase [Clostridiales bacterium]|jgi:predicted acetyltransferase|nr:GNAT family N-acetyltransferase [Clostridiales bacterium]